MDSHILIIMLSGLVLLAMSWLPRVLHRRPLSLPILYILFGLLIFTLPLGLTPLDPIAESTALEYGTEVVVIVALTGAGLMIDSPPGLRRWRLVWRLLGVTMLLSIVLVGLLGWGLLGLTPAAAILLAAVLAPTDPVLASDVQVGPPLGGEEDDVRFNLTLEAGLNDGLAFPFVYLSIAAIGMTSLGGWVMDWALMDLLYRIVVGITAGFLIGRLLAYFIFHFSGESELAETSEGLIALAITFTAYGFTEAINGYGFLAVFIAAVTIRHYSAEHHYHKQVYGFIEQVERILLAGTLVLFGGAIASGLLAPLTLPAILVGLIFIFLVRPLTGMLALIGTKIPHRERLAISFFGIRGIGSFYYLAFGLNHGEFQESGLLWATVGFVVLISIIIHGVSVTPFIRYIDKRRERVPREEAIQQIVEEM